MDGKNWQIIGFIVVLLVGGLIGYAISPTEITGLSDTEIEEKIDDAVEQAITEKNAEIEALQDFITNSENVTDTEDEEEEKDELEGYLIDKLFLETHVSETLSDRELDLFDGEVEFDGDEYDAEEIFSFTNLTLKANENDFEGNVYLTIPKERVSYKFVFENSFDVSEINDEETLVFDLLGKEVEISEWEDNEITFTQGKKYTIEEFESVEVDEKKIILLAVSEDSVLINIDETKYIINKGRTKTIDDLDIKVLEVFEGNQFTKGFTTIYIGEDVEITILDGDEYEEDSIWEWVIDEHSIGLELIEEFMELEEDYNALAPEEKICLPNYYVCIQYNGLAEESKEAYTFELDTKDENDYVRVEGNFLSGLEDYDRVYINSTGIYDRKLNLIGESIELGDTELILEINGKITIEDFEVNFALDWTNVGDDDEDYLTDYGILIENPEDSAENQEFEISVPEEKLSGSLSVRQGFEETILE